MSRHLRLDLNTDPDADAMDRAPELSLWIDADEDLNRHVVLMIGACWGNAGRFLEMTPEQARNLSAMLKQLADAATLVAA